VDAKRHRLGLHVSEIMEALERADAPRDEGVHPEHGPIRRVSGVSGVGRTVHFIVKGDQLPMVLVDIETDGEAAP
jgi:hypothetical protein